MVGDIDILKSKSFVSLSVQNIGLTCPRTKKSIYKKNFQVDTKEDAVVAEEAVVVVIAEVRVDVAAVEVADVEILTPDTSQSETCSTPQTATTCINLFGVTPRLNGSLFRINMHLLYLWEACLP